MTRLAILLACTTAMAAVPAHARDGQWYIGVDAGVLLEDQVDVDLGGDDGLQENLAFADTNAGLDADIVFGYDFGNFRLEAEGGYKRASYEGLTVVNPALGLTDPPFQPFTVQNERDLSIWSGMLNGLFEYGNTVQIFAGGGAGFANLSLPVEVNGVGTLIDDSTTDFAWQLLAGARVAVTDNLDLGLKYRYFVIDEFELQDVNGTPLEADFQSHSIMASVLYNFGRKTEAPPPPIALAPPPAPPAPPAPPPPPPRPQPAPPPPPPPCETGPYIVFFDWDSAAITQGAANILDQAITAYNNCGQSRVMLAGHTDRSGNARYNMQLAERRNMAVSNYISSKGIPAARISSAAFGESQPRVATPDGVRERENRRVEVTYGPGSGM